MANTTQRNPQKAQRAKPTKASTMKAAKTNKKDRKRARVTAESDEDEFSEKSDSRVKKKQCTKQQRKVSDDDSDIDVILHFG